MIKAQTSSNPLGTERVGKLLARYAIPGVISLIINSLYNMVDQIFIGQGVGLLGNGATNIISPIATIAIAFSSLLGTVLPLISVFIWEKESRKRRPVRWETP
ncbi:MAG: hypothetical protein ACI4IV_06880 [Acutalibacteraceae bacterium]